MTLFLNDLAGNAGIGGGDGSREFVVIVFGAMDTKSNGCFDSC